jgi:hypothetical protein
MMVASVCSAVAQTVVKSGELKQIHYYLSASTDCKSRGETSISMISNPSHGTITTVHEDKYPHFSPTDHHSFCNTVLLPAIVVMYQSDPNFKGLDQASYDVLFPTGRVERVGVTISVQ